MLRFLSVQTCFWVHCNDRLEPLGCDELRATTATAARVPHAALGSFVGGELAGEGARQTHTH